MSDKQNQYIVKTLFACEDILLEELNALGAIDAKKITRAVVCQADDETMYRINYCSRYALRVLKYVTRFPAANEKQLYDEIQKIDWSQYLNVYDTLAVDAVAVQSNLNHTLYISQKTKDAIADQFASKHNARPSVNLDKPTLRIHIHLSNDIATLMFDSSGGSLHKRGYRVSQGDAPVNEVLAACLIALSGWDKQTHFLDFMCGSGTFLIEASMAAKNIPASHFRQFFGFETWQDFDANLWREVKAKADEKILPEVPCKITGVERSFAMVEKSLQNIATIGLRDDIEMVASSFDQYEPSDEKYCIVTNPPYGGRITVEDLFGLYKRIGDTLKNKYKGSQAWLFTANKEAAGHIGLHASRRLPMYNGSLECRFLKYEMYDGTKKFKKINSSQENQ